MKKRKMMRKKMMKRKMAWKMKNNLKLLRHQKKAKNNDKDIELK